MMLQVLIDILLDGDADSGFGGSIVIAGEIRLAEPRGPPELASTQTFVAIL